MHVIITGAAGELGRAVVAAFERLGDTITAIDQAEGPVSGVTTVQTIGVDLGDPHQTRAAIADQVATHGKIGALVHLVGGFSWLPVMGSTLEDWSSLHAVNVGTTLNVIHAATPHICAGGSIVCVGAAGAQPARAGMAPYGAAKAGVARIVEALSEELKDRKIRVNAVAPAIIDTARNRADMPDADPADWTSPEAIADVIAFLAGSGARAINGALVPVTNNG
jgi:NAD(P)-dependent dehydrogenase (short-subunit alcohol dehydrogenase family)